MSRLYLILLRYNIIYIEAQMQLCIKSTCLYIYEGIDCLIYQDGYNDSILVCCDTSYICKYHIGAGVCIHIPVCTYVCIQLSACTYVCIDLCLYYECIVWLKTTHWVLYAHICIIVILIYSWLALYHLLQSGQCFPLLWDYTVCSIG